ncbi:MAG: hypothetical protein F9K37_12315 [Bacteroidales bacterium]|nr:MAG: hypothetical protein F9K37_12315 [Bacteroidales bacterium]
MNQGKFNKPIIGFIGGLLLPVLTFVGIYLALYKGKNFFDFVEITWLQGNMSRVLSLSMLPNLGLFFAFIWTNKLKSAQGVLGVTIVLAFAIIILRFI